MMNEWTDESSHNHMVDPAWPVSVYRDLIFAKETCAEAWDDHRYRNIAVTYSQYRRSVDARRSSAEAAP